MGKAKNGELARWLETHVDYDEDTCLDWPFGSRNRGYGFLLYKGRWRLAHTIMCRLAHGEPNAIEFHAAHSCGNPLCCNPKHLRWATPRGNSNDRWRHRTIIKGERCGHAKLDADKVRAIREAAADYSTRQIASAFAVSVGTIRSVLNGQSWADVH